MKKKPIQNTFQYPEEIQKSYHKLMRTKESFLRKISDADKQKLISSYVALEKAYLQNTTAELNLNLTNKYRKSKKKTGRFGRIK